MNTFARLVKNFFMIFAARGTVNLFQVIQFAIIARYLGSGGFGKFYYIYSFIMILEILSDLGLRVIAVREVAKNREHTSELFGNVIILKGFFAMSTIGIACVIGIFHGFHEFGWAFFLAGLIAISQNLSDVSIWIIRGHERMEYEAGLVLLTKVGLLIMILFVVKMHLGILYFFYVMLVSNLIRVAGAFQIASSKFGKPKFKIDPDSWKKLFIYSLPLGITLLLPVLSRRSNIFILGSLSDDVAVGIFSSAFMLIRPLNLFIGPFIHSAFPVFSKLANKSKDSFQRSFELSFKFLFIIGIPVAMVFLVIPDKILQLVFGGKFLEATSIVRIIGISIIFSFLNQLFRYILSAINRQVVELYSTISSLVVNVCLAFILIPRFGYMGAGYALLTAEIVMFCIKFIFIKKYMSVAFIVKTIPKSFISGILMFICLFALRNSFFLFPLILGIGIYVLSLFLMGNISSEEKKIFRKAFFWNL